MLLLFFLTMVVRNEDWVASSLVLPWAMFGTPCSLGSRDNPLENLSLICLFLYSSSCSHYFFCFSSLGSVTAHVVLYVLGFMFSAYFLYITNKVGLYGE